MVGRTSQELAVAGPTEVTWIGLLNDRMFEQFDEFSASVEIKDDALAPDRPTFEGLHAENLAYRP